MLRETAHCHLSDQPPARTPDRSLDPRVRYLTHRFRVVGAGTADVVRALTSAHRLLDGYFCRETLLVEPRPHGEVVTVTNVSGTHAEAGTDAGERTSSGAEAMSPGPQSAAEIPLDALAQAVDRGVHLIVCGRGHGATTELTDRLRRRVPLSAALVMPHGDAVEVEFQVRDRPGLDREILPFVERVTRAFVATRTVDTLRDAGHSAVGPRAMDEDAHALGGPSGDRRHPRPRPGGCSSAPPGESPLFVRRFHELVDADPDRLAVVDGEDVLTYADLAALSSRLAWGLCRRGLGKGARVMILARRRALLVAMEIAGFKVGATLCILDPRHPTAYLRSCADVLRPDLVVDMADVPAVADDTVRAADLLDDVPETPPGAFRSDVLGYDDCAIVTFTSGTTATPKAVAGRYGSLTAFFDWMDDHVGPLAGRRFGLCSSLGHDPLQRDIMTPLWLGGSITVPDESVLSAPVDLRAWLDANQVEVLCMNPVMATALSDASKALPSLRVLFFVGSVLTRDQVTAIRRVAADARIINLYGSTETQRAVGFFEVPSDPRALANLPDVIPLGQGMKDVQLMVASREGEERRPRLPFQVGEILVRSRDVALGYLGDAAATAARFATGVFGADDDIPTYATGDLGYLSPRHGVVYVGRVDDQYKINGFRVELDQINAACREHAVVKDAVTVVVTIDGHHTLVTWLVPTDPIVTVEPTRFRAFLAERLPAYMLPARIETITDLPLTPNNKVDRARLAAMARTSASPPSEGRPEDGHRPAEGGNGLVRAMTAFVSRHTGRSRASVPTDVPLDLLGIDSLRFLSLVQRIGGAAEVRSRCGRTPRVTMSIDELAGGAAATRSAVPSEARRRDERRTSGTSGTNGADGFGHGASECTPRPRDLLGPVTEVTETSISFGPLTFEHLCSNSYLGLGSHPDLRENVARFIRDRATLCAHGSAELNGTTVWHERLIEELSRAHETETAVLYSSGYLANVSVIPALAGPGDEVFVDAACHKSIIDGCILSGADIHVYAHNDAADLELSLRQATQGSRKLIITEGVFSVDGDILDLPSVRALAQQYGCRLLVDDACAVGQIGRTGRGTAEHFGLPDAIDVTVGTLAKTLCASGGYVACDRETADRLRLKRGETFSTAIPPLQAFIAAEAARLLRTEGSSLTARLARNAAIWRDSLVTAGFDIGTSATAITPLRYEDEGRMRRAFLHALDVGVYCLPAGRAWSATGFALRTSVTAAHDPRRLGDIAARLR